MALQRKLGKPTDQRMALLRGQVTALLLHGKIETTYHRALEVRRMAEKLITAAVREDGNFTSRQMKVSSPKVDGKGKKVLISKTSRNGAKYYVVDREIRMELRRVDAPSRLHARRKAIALIYRVKDAEGKTLNVVNKLYDDIAPRFKGINGGYTRIYKLGPRRGDAAEMALLELVR